jgi:hypothetical protein
MITGALPPTALGPLIKESGLRSAESLLNNRTRRFGSRLLSTPSRGPDGDTVINPASEMVRQSPLVTTKPRFPDDDPTGGSQATTGKGNGQRFGKGRRLWLTAYGMLQQIRCAVTSPPRMKTGYLAAGDCAAQSLWKPHGCCGPGPP